MRHAYMLRSVVAVVALSGCGARSGLDAGSGGSTSATSASTTQSSALSSSVASSSASSSTGTGGCSGFIDVMVDKVAGTQHFATGCPAGPAPTANGHLFFGPTTSGRLIIQGCAGEVSVDPGIGFQVEHALSVGMYGGGITTYKLNGTTYSGNNLELTVTAFGGVGEPIEGTFATFASSNGDDFQLTGTFHVCRTPDLAAP
jgi:hypothetical protein